MYEQLKTEEHIHGEVEAVYFSTDYDLGQFEDSYSTMPWLAIPFEENERVRALGAQWNVGKIPTVIVIDNQGNIIDGEGRDTITSAKGNFEAIKQRWLLG